MSAKDTVCTITRSGTAVAIRQDNSVREVLYHQLGGAWNPTWNPRAKLETSNQDSLPQIQTAQVEDGVLQVLTTEGERSMPLKRNDSPTQVLFGCNLISCTPEHGNALGFRDDAAVVLCGDRIGWVGAQCDLSGCGLDLSAATHTNLEGRLVSPGLIDCHAHPLFAGRRADEFARRARGDHYLDIAREGGGISATVVPTRSASQEELAASCHQRVTRALMSGTSTMEAKSGYDLSVEGELRLLRVAAIVDALHPTTLVPTLLGAHAIPPEFRDDRAGFVASVIEQMIPRVANERLARAVDVYCDEGAFTLAECESILRAGQSHGLDIKAHVGQFADLQAPQLLAKLGALSADHLEQVSPEGMTAMAKRGVIATMLPGACVQLRMTPPPVKALRAAGVTLALASDLNPGTAHSETLPLAMWLAATHFEMTVEEAWLGVTRHASSALSRSDIGQLNAGYHADLVVWDAEIPAEIPYHFGVNLVHQVFKDGACRVGHPG